MGAARRLEVGFYRPHQFPEPESTPPTNCLRALARAGGVSRDIGAVELRFREFKLGAEENELLVDFLVGGVGKQARLVDFYKHRNDVGEVRRVMNRVKEAFLASPSSPSPFRLNLGHLFSMYDGSVDTAIDYFFGPDPLRQQWGEHVSAVHKLPIGATQTLTHPTTVVLTAPCCWIHLLGYHLSIGYRWRIVDDSGKGAEGEEESEEEEEGVETGGSSGEELQTDDWDSENAVDESDDEE